jgi:hypothetical protein
MEEITPVITHQGVDVELDELVPELIVRSVGAIGAGGLRVHLLRPERKSVNSYKS